MHYIEVILPLPLPGVFTYVLKASELKENPVGSRVIVPFGKRKIYTGIIAKVLDGPAPSQYTVREVLEVLDDEPIITGKQLEFITWISKYYMSAIGDVYNSAIPTNLKLSSESYVAILPDVEIEYGDLDDHEYNVIQFLEKNELSSDEIRQITGLKNPYRILKSLRDKGYINLFEKVRDKYVSKKETRVRLSSDFNTEEALDNLTQILEKHQKQLDVIIAYLKKVDVLHDPSLNDRGISRKDLLSAGVSKSSLQTLIRNDIMESWDQVVDRFSFDDLEIRESPDLSDLQKLKREEIEKAFHDKQVVLLKGITGSGKTEIYMDLIRDRISKQEQVLYLLPEIALTTQIIKRFRRVFGDRFGIYHSRFSDNERAETYQNCLKGKYDFIIGVRSAIYLPFHHLSMIIIDEEHETSYKQYDPAPRYHARDAAIYLAHLHNAKVLLASATPSLESYHNAREGKYGYVELNERFEAQPLPEIAFADLVRARQQKKLKGSTSAVLLEAIESSLVHGKQVILFQNRRGYAPFIQCNNCQHIPKCPNCSVSLTYHIYQNQLICHYCGFKQYYDPNCQSCNSDKLRTVGVGTEKIEEELGLLMPDVRIKRMDLDTTRSKYAYQQIIDDFESGEIRILIGTQMITKGLDFEHVNLVGVYDADRMIHFPDFRSHERAFQMITQVSGRSGRKYERGKVIIQTSDPDQTLLKHIREGHLDLFYEQELKERANFRYPPFYRLIRIVVRHRDKQTALQGANQLYILIKKDLGDHRTLNPVEPVVSKIRNFYIYEILIKIEKHQVNLSAIKEFLQACRDTLLALPTFKSLLIHFDVDPL